MAVLYQKEIDALQGKLRIRAGPERVMELEKKIAAHHKKHEELAKKIKELEKKIKDTDKVFEKQTGLRESGNEKIESNDFWFWANKTMRIDL
jgi:peptidoglycan hydrolase CwlO-like protein